MIELDQAIARSPATQLGALPSDHEILRLSRQIQLAIAQSSFREDLVRAVGQHLFQKLYENDGIAFFSVYFALLEVIADQKLVKELTNWVLMADDEVLLRDDQLMIVAEVQPQSDSRID